ncbi:hypothetical protein PHMEG_00013209 [Phytophthora megakarya]|uniref:Reverse transcriptase Ty1/copia-type domain-containing protein n=1 Tax=Phytophthora megakarya TaxID=4795 RepID=A0A225W8X9_9STRA|nr:hypothetical protein PHMEG_00013209 [Phytophthora megakarya]
MRLNNEEEDAIADAIASGDSVRSALSSVGDYFSSSDDEENGEEHERLGTSFRRSTRIREQNVRLWDYEVDLPESLVIQFVNAILESTELLRNNTWELVEKPVGVKVLTNKWVFVRKCKQEDVERHQARITIKGCQQKYGLDFWETYAPVVCAEAVRLILLLALHFGLLCRHIDVVTAFLNGPIDAEIYMKQPEFFDDGTGRGPRIWYKTLDKYLSRCGFHRSKVYGEICYRWINGCPIFLTLYVDDIGIPASMENIELAVAELRKKFKLKDLGDVSHLLSMEINYVPGIMLSISQRGYIGPPLERFKMDLCKAMPTPQAKGKGQGQHSASWRPRKRCDYLVSCTLSDIANAVRTLGKFLNCFTKEHFVLAKRGLRYLQGTREFGLVWYKPETPALQLIAYADADLGNEKDDRRSITDYVLQLNGCTFAYISKKQPIKTDDTCSAEFVAASECSNMIMWTIMYNQTAIHVIGEVSSGYKVKSSDLKFHKIRYFVERGVFKVEYCPSEDNIADIFTKTLGSQQFSKLRLCLNVLAVPGMKKCHDASE